METSDVLKPGINIRPVMTSEMAKELILNLYGLKVKKIKEMVSYDDKNYKIDVESMHSNPHIQQIYPHGYMFKVLNSMDSQKTHVDAEHEAVQMLKNKVNICCPQPVYNLEGTYRSLQKIMYQSDDKEWLKNNEGENGEPASGYHIVRLLTFVPGSIFANVPYVPNLLYQAGEYVAKMEKTLMGWKHKALTEHKTMWALKSVPDLKDFVYAVSDDKRKNLVEDVLKAFKEDVLPNEHKFQTGVIHGDYNEQNIIVDAREKENDSSSDVQYDIVGVIDFGDMQDTAYVYEVAITIMYMMVESKIVDPLEVGGHVLAGYFTHMDLNEEEFDVLKTCVAGRFAQSLVLGAYTHMQDPSNDYVIVTAARGWGILERFWNTPKQQIYTKWREIISSYRT